MYKFIFFFSVARPGISEIVVRVGYRYVVEMMVLRWLGLMAGSDPSLRWRGVLHYSVLKSRVNHTGANKLNPNKTRSLAAAWLWSIKKQHSRLDDQSHSLYYSLANSHILFHISLSYPFLSSWNIPVHFSFILSHFAHQKVSVIIIDSLHATCNCLPTIFSTHSSSKNILLVQSFSHTISFFCNTSY